MDEFVTRKEFEAFKKKIELRDLLHEVPMVNIDGQYGDPKVRFDPRPWQGSSYVGKSFSECPSDYLEMLASGAEWRAKKCYDEAVAATDEVALEGASKGVRYAKKDAALARKWAERNKGKPLLRQPPVTPFDDDSDGEEYPWTQRR